MKTMVSITKKLFFLMIALAMLPGSLTACQKQVTPEQATTQAPAPTVDQSGFAWSIVVKKWEVSADLSGSQAAQQYNGDVTQIKYNEKPSDGNTFLLVDLIVTKQVAGASTFSWKNLSVRDSAGNLYARMENDTFLTNFNFPRLKSTDLTLGENKGFICFEIPTAAAKDPLSLVYAAADETVELPLQ